MQLFSNRIANKTELRRNINCKEMFRIQFCDYTFKASKSGHVQPQDRNRTTVTIARGLPTLKCYSLWNQPTPTISNNRLVFGLTVVVIVEESLLTGQTD